MVLDILHVHDFLLILLYMEEWRRWRRRDRSLESRLSRVGMVMDFAWEDLRIGHPTIEVLDGYG